MAGINKQERVWFRLYTSVGILILFCLSWLYWHQHNQTTATIELSLLERGRSHFESILLTRRWAAEHGGVYVIKRPGVVSNPFLSGTDIKAADGRVLVLHNPALITREISEYAKEDANFSFHITSDRPLNPANRPDVWESKAIKRFHAGVKEHFDKTSDDGKTYFRYMAPVYVEESCLTCHGHHGYKVGDVRGGISVRFNISDVEAALRKSLWYDAAAFLFLAVFIPLAFFSLIRIFQKKINLAEQQILDLANTDSLTGLSSRRFLMDQAEQEYNQSKRYGHALSFIMLDLDHFKQINDQYGHQIGDKMLIDVAKALQANIRSSDCVARYGGEELAILLTESNLQAAAELAEKLRGIISRIEIENEGKIIKITASLGVSSIDADYSEDSIKGIDQLIKDADDALYRAKESGRNRVCITDNP